MARTKLAVHIASLKSAITLVEGETGCKTLEELYSKVAKKYVTLTSEMAEYDPLSVQVVKARIGELLETNQITLKTAPGRRSGGTGGTSQKEIILSALVEADKEIDSILTALTENESMTVVANSLKSRLSNIFDIVENLHKRQPSANSTENSEADEILPPTTEETETEIVEPLENAA